MCTNFYESNIPSELRSYYHNDPIVRTIIDSFRADPEFLNATTEDLWRVICLTALKTKDDYFKQVIKIC